MTMLFRGLLQKSRLIIDVHRNDVVENLEILIADTPRPNVRQRHATAFGCSGRAPIGRLTNVIGVGASGVDFDSICKASLIDEMAEYSFRRWRAADVAHANE
jgi:uncharacterized metal-binding protein